MLFSLLELLAEARRSFSFSLFSSPFFYIFRLFISLGFILGNFCSAFFFYFFLLTYSGFTPLVPAMLFYSLTCLFGSRDASDVPCAHCASISVTLFSISESSTWFFRICFFLNVLACSFLMVYVQVFSLF